MPVLNILGGTFVNIANLFDFDDAATAAAAANDPFSDLFSWVDDIFGGSLFADSGDESADAVIADAGASQIQSVLSEFADDHSGVDFTDTG